MQPTLTPQEFGDKLRHATLKERSAAQEHFIDLCHLVGHATPAEKDPAGESFTFEAGASQTETPVPATAQVPAAPFTPGEDITDSYYL